MTDEELTAIEVRALRATAGPWTGKKDSGVSSKEGSIFETGCGCCTEKDFSVYDASFIACARSDVPTLIAEVRSLRAERDDARRDAARLLDKLTTTKWQRDQHEKDAMKLIRPC